MISINLSSIQKLAAAILRQIHRRVSNFDKNHPVAPIGNRYIAAVATPAWETSDTSTVELGARASPNIHRPAQTILPHRNFSRAEHSVERSTKSAALTLDVSVQCFKNTGKLGWVLRAICPLQLMLRMHELMKLAANEQRVFGRTDHRPDSRKNVGGGTIDEDTRSRRVRGEEAA
jgi:hypothetical protein